MPHLDKRALLLLELLARGSAIVLWRAGHLHLQPEEAQHHADGCASPASKRYQLPSGMIAMSLGYEQVHSSPAFSRVRLQP